MECIICKTTDWENVDQFRIKPEGMSICKGCGFVSYPSKWKSQEEIKQHYRSDYRTHPTSNNVFTGQRKIHFHNAFLISVFEEWNKKGVDSPNVFEVGAAYGMALAYIRDAYRGANVFGSELTISYRRNAFHEYGIDLQEDFDDSREYNLIMSYKVAEHQTNICEDLDKYHSTLKDDGYLYISVPTWFESMTNFGASGFDIEYYYDPTHINAWTKAHFEYLLRVHGFEIVKQDQLMYDSTYLCKKVSKNTDEKPVNLYLQVKEAMKKIKEAYGFFLEKNYEAAISTFPNYPAAHASYFEINRKAIHEKGWEYTKQNIIQKCLQDCGNSAEAYVMAIDLCMRFDQFDDAIFFAELCLKIKPENPVALNCLINIMREKAIRAPTPSAKIHYFIQARDIAKHLKNVSAQHFREATDYIYFFNSKIDKGVYENYVNAKASQ